MATVSAHEQRIVKTRTADGPAPNMPDYERARTTFSWEAARAALDGLPGGRGINIAHEAVDRHATGGRANQVALRWLGRNGERDITYRALAEWTNRFANLLEELGLEDGERLFTPIGRVPELYVATLGTFNRGGVVCPRFAAFRPGASARAARAR